MTALTIRVEQHPLSTPKPLTFAIMQGSTYIGELSYEQVKAALQSFDAKREAYEKATGNKWGVLDPLRNAAPALHAPALYHGEPDNEERCGFCGATLAACVCNDWT